MVLPMASTTTKKTAAAKKAATRKPAKKTTAKAASTKKPAKTTAKAAPAKKAAAKKTAAKKAPAKRKSKWESRAVLRMVEPGSQVECILCGERVKFQAKMRHQQAICNIYEKNAWVRVDHYHYPCYKEAKEPYGPAEN